MLSKIKNILKSCFLFWKSFILESDKKKFLRNNQSAFKTQVIVLLSTVLVTFVLYSSMRPAVRGACRVILQSDNSSFDMGMGRITGVEAKKATLGTTLREVKSIGTLKANAEVIIKSEIAGKISEILFTEGSEVKKGDTLIKFEDDLYKAEKDKYEAEYNLRKSEFERVDSLYKKNVGSKKAYDEAYSQMQAAKAQLDSANAHLERTIIKAPFDGVIGILRGSASPGNIVQQQAELVYIVDNSMVRVEFAVPAKFIDDIAVGQTVEVTVDAFKDRVFSGAVDAIDSEIDTRNHSVLVRAIVPNKSGNLRHGMFANVKLITGEKSDVILIDEDALLREGSIEYVWVIDDKGRAYRKRVLSGAKDINGVEILAGLKAGETVVTTGQLKLTEGGKTKILNKEEYEESGKSQSDNADNTHDENLSTGEQDDPALNDEATDVKKVENAVASEDVSSDSTAAEVGMKSSSIFDKIKNFFGNLLVKNNDDVSGDSSPDANVDVGKSASDSDNDDVSKQTKDDSGTSQPNTEAVGNTDQTDDETAPAKAEDSDKQVDGDSEKADASVTASSTEKETQTSESTEDTDTEKKSATKGDE